MEALLSKLAGDIPNLVAIIIVVYLFLRANERIAKDFNETIKNRDTLFLTQYGANITALSKVVEELQNINVLQASHAKETSDITPAPKKQALADWFVAHGMKRGDANQLAKLTITTMNEQLALDVKNHCKGLTK